MSTDDATQPATGQPSPTTSPAISGGRAILLSGMSIVAGSAVLAAVTWSYWPRPTAAAFNSEPLSQLATHRHREASTTAPAGPIVVEPGPAYGRALGTLPDSADSPGWPCYLGPTHNSVSEETGVVLDWSDEGPPLRWRRPLGEGYSAPVAVGNRLIVMHRWDDREIVECLDPATGERQWTFDRPANYQCEYNYTNGPISTPAIDGNQVFTLGIAGNLHCLSLDSGSLLWSRELATDYGANLGMFGVGASPLVEDDRLIVNLGGQSPPAGIVALDKQSGKTLWTATSDPAGYATPVAATINSTRYLFVFNDVGLVCLAPDDGTVHWRVPFRSMKVESPNATTPMVVDDMVFVSAHMKGSLCLRILPDGSYEEVWQDRRVLDCQYNNLLCIDGYLYGFSAFERSRSFRCLELATGMLCWRWKSKVLHGVALAVDDRFLLLGERGHLFSMDIDPRQPRPRAETSKPVIAQPCYTVPALHRGLLYLRNEKELVCFDLRG